MATQKQIDANRRNAARSTGPVTDSGKARSRRNALKHGLAGSGLVLPEDDFAAVQDRMAEWNSSLKPFDNYETWLLEVVAVETIRVDRCRIHDRVLRDEQIRRADESWDDDLAQEADELAAKMATKPAVVAKLRATVPGATILLDRWRSLARALEQGDWSADQEGLALDLLGTPKALREGAASPLFAGPDVEDLTHRRTLVGEQISRLEWLIAEVLPARDADRRDLRKAGLPDLADRQLALLHRYESRCFRRLTWAAGQMRSQRRGGRAVPDRQVESAYSRPWNPVASPVVASPPIPSPPPPPAEPHVYGRPLLQHVLGAADLKYVMKAANIAVPANPAPKAKRPKNVPSPKDRPSRRPGASS